MKCEMCDTRPAIGSDIFFREIDLGYWEGGDVKFVPHDDSAFLHVCGKCEKILVARWNSLVGRIEKKAQQRRSK